MSWEALRKHRQVEVKYGKEMWCARNKAFEPDFDAVYMIPAQKFSAVPKVYFIA